MFIQKECLSVNINIITTSNHNYLLSPSYFIVKHPQEVMRFTETSRHICSVSSQITRASIDALKSWFRDEMTKTDWQLIMELKKTFEII